MKSRILFLAALLVVSAGVAFAGKDDPKKTGVAVFPIKGSELVKVVYKGETAGKVKVNIFNQAGSLVLSEAITGMDGFILPVNFAGLASGEYTVEVTDVAGKKVEKVVYQPNKTIKHIHISKIGNESKYLVSIANSGAEVISLKIFDNARNLVYTEETAIKGDFAQVYKLNTDSSNYTFEVTDKSGATKTIRF